MLGALCVGIIEGGVLGVERFGEAVLGRQLAQLCVVEGAKG